MGNLYVALHSWLFARSRNGCFLLRIEDSDPMRSDQSATEIIMEDMRWLNLAWDEEPYFQSKRAERYREIVDRMMSAGVAYKCFCSKSRLRDLRRRQMRDNVKPKYDGRCYLDRKNPDTGRFVVRFRNPEKGHVGFNDLIRGEIIFKNEELDDLIICREDGTPTYNLCSVVDDLDMKVTHVIRGGDHINNTPRQINILNSLGEKVPEYAHLGMLLDEDGGRFSKRRHSAGLNAYREEGFLPEAITNYLLQVGGSRCDGEVFDLDEGVERFRISNLSKADSRFSRDKLLWYNRRYMRKLPRNYVAERFSEFATRYGLDLHELEAGKIIDTFGSRHSTFMEMVREAPYLRGEVDVPDVSTMRNIHRSSTDLINHLHSSLSLLDDRRWNRQEIALILEETRKMFSVDASTLGNLVRTMIIGGAQSPPISAVMSLLGRRRCLRQIRSAHQKLIDEPHGETV